MYTEARTAPSTLASRSPADSVAVPGLEAPDPAELGLQLGADPLVEGGGRARAGLGQEPPERSGGGRAIATAPSSSGARSRAAPGRRRAASSRPGRPTHGPTRRSPPGRSGSPRGRRRVQLDQVAAGVVGQRRHVSRDREQDRAAADERVDEPPGQGRRCAAIAASSRDLPPGHFRNGTRPGFASIRGAAVVAGAPDRGIVMLPAIRAVWHGANQAAMRWLSRRAVGIAQRSVRPKASASVARLSQSSSALGSRPTHSGHWPPLAGIERIAPTGPDQLGHPLRRQLEDQPAVADHGEDPIVDPQGGGTEAPRPAIGRRRTDHPRFVGQGADQSGKHLLGGVAAGRHPLAFASRSMSTAITSGQCCLSKTSSDDLIRSFWNVRYSTLSTGPTGVLVTKS